MPPEPPAGRALRAVALHALPTLLWAALATPALAFDDDRALAGFTAPPAAATRAGPVTGLEWERRLRAADRLGPVPLAGGGAALLQAAREARWADTMALLQTGRADANARDEASGHTLALAARAGQDELVRALLRQGADPTRVGEDGFTALGAAAFAGRRSTVRLLLRAGVDAHQWGATGQTALHLAAIAGQVEVLAEMQRAGVDIETLNRQRETALDTAGAAGQQQAMAWLIAAGADLQQAGRR